MRIMQICPDLAGGGGLQKSLVEIACALNAQEGTECFTVAASLGEYGDALEPSRFHALDLNKARFGVNLLRHVLALRALLRLYRPDILHVRSRYPAWVGFLASKCAGYPVKIVSTWHGRHIANRFSLRALYNKGLLKADRVIAVSSWVKSEILRQTAPRYRPYLAEKITVVPRGASSTRFDRAQASPLALRDALKRKYGIDDKAPLIGLPGRVTQWKGGLYLLEVLRRLAGCGVDDWVCVMAGDGSKHRYKKRLQEEIRRSGLPVYVIDSVADMPSFYAACAVAVLPNLAPEPFGRVAIEAQMAGTPVIAHRIGALAETVSPPNVLVETGDSESFARALIEILRNASSGKESERTARADLRKTLIARYADAKMIQATLGVYRELYRPTSAES